MSHRLTTMLSPLLEVFSKKSNNWLNQVIFSFSVIPSFTKEKDLERLIQKLKLIKELVNFGLFFE